MPELNKTTTEGIPYIGLDLDGDGKIDTIGVLLVDGLKVEKFTDANPGSVKLSGSLPPLVAGSAIVGKVGIDQTTPGTTNGVQIISALPLGSNKIGGVTIADGDLAAVGAKADAAVIDPILAAGLIALTKGQLKQMQGSGSGNQPIGIVNSSIIIPTDKQSLYRIQVITTTTALGANATYTSGSINGINAKRITGLVNANQSGNLYFEHSKDGSAWVRTRTVAFVASTPQSFDEPFYAQYMRLVFTNGASAQGSFELDGYLSVE